MAAVDNFIASSSSLEKPVENVFAITKHDTDELAYVTRALYIGGDGDVALIAKGDTVAQTFTGLLAGTLLPVRAKQVLSTGTTATNILGLY